MRNFSDLLPDQTEERGGLDRVGVEAALLAHLAAQHAELAPASTAGSMYVDAESSAGLKLNLRAPS